MPCLFVTGSSARGPPARLREPHQRPLAGQEVVAGKAWAQLAVQVGPLVLLGLHVVEEPWSASATSVLTLLSLRSVKLVLQTTLPVAVVGGQRELRAQALGGQQ